MNHVVAATARKRGIPRVVSPRGMLEEWSLQYRGWRKKAAWLAYQRRDLRTATAFSATSAAEARAIRAARLDQPIAVIPNGIHVPDASAAFSREAPERVALFMSRLHPKKGLLDLVEAWDRVRPAGWRLVIAGPDEGDYRRVVETAIGQTKCVDRISMVGSLEGDAKHAALMSAQLFVLPSYSENFGIVVGEALASGVPVVTTKATPWASIRDRGCGWWIDTGAAALAAALAEATARDAGALQEMGRRGRALVLAELSWEAVAANHIALYDWMLGRAPRPAFVV